MADLRVRVLQLLTGASLTLFLCCDIQFRPVVRKDAVPAPSADKIDVRVLLDISEDFSKYRFLSTIGAPSGVSYQFHFGEEARDPFLALMNGLFVEVAVNGPGESRQGHDFVAVPRFINTSADLAGFPASFVETTIELQFLAMASGRSFRINGTGKDDQMFRGPARQFSDQFGDAALQGALRDLQVNIIKNRRLFLLK